MIARAHTCSLHQSILGASEIFHSMDPLKIMVVRCTINSGGKDAHID